MGRILETYSRLGREAFFGNAITPERNAARGGKYQDFERDTSVYWHPQISAGVARQIGGLIRGKWRDQGAEAGHLGYPYTDELPTRRVGRFNHFEGGSIYWKSGDPEAHVIQGRIRDASQNQDWEAGPLRFSITDEITTPNNDGKYNHFDGGSIYWSPGTGAHIFKGHIRSYWAKLGWERSRIGFPTSNEYPEHLGAVQQDFQNERLQWVPGCHRVLPEYEESYGSYHQTYWIMEQDETWSPESIAQEVITNFNQYFTFTGCPDKLEEGYKCYLKTVIGKLAPVQVTHISSSGFDLLSLDSHPEGRDRKITFNFVPLQVLGKRYIALGVKAWGPVSDVSLLGPINAETVTRASWTRLFSKYR